MTPLLPLLLAACASAVDGHSFPAGGRTAFAGCSPPPSHLDFFYPTPSDCPNPIEQLNLHLSRNHSRFTGGAAFGVVRASVYDVWNVVSQFGDVSWWQYGPNGPMFEDARAVSPAEYARVRERFPQAKAPTNAAHELRTKKPRLGLQAALPLAPLFEELLESGLSADGTSYVQRYRNLFGMMGAAEVVTTVTLTPDPEDGGYTQVRWQAHFEGTPQNLAFIYSELQVVAYQAAVESLKTRFDGNTVGTLKVSGVVGAGEQSYILSVNLNGTRAVSPIGGPLSVSLDFPQESNLKLEFSVFLPRCPGKVSKVKVCYLDGYERFDGMDKEVILFSGVIELDPIAINQKKVFSHSIAGVTVTAQVVLFPKLVMRPPREYTFKHAVQTALGLTKEFGSHLMQMLDITGQHNHAPPEYADYAVYEHSRASAPLPIDAGRVLRLPLNESFFRCNKWLRFQDAISPRKLARMQERLLEAAYEQIGGFVRRSLERPGDDGQFTAFIDGHRWLKPPIPLMERWTDDEEFARQFLQGVNPMIVRRARTASDIPPCFHRLSPPPHKDYPDSTVLLLLKAGRIFYADYSVLSKIPMQFGGRTRNIPMWVYPAFVVFYRNSNNQLDIIGIRLDPKMRPDAFVYTPAMRETHPNLWLLAKIHVNCADNQVHQFSAHLAATHLQIEPIAIAAERVFGANPKHAIGQMLKPHFFETVAINTMARVILVGQIFTITQTTFSVGTFGGVLLAREHYLNLDLFNSSFPEELASRGFGRDGSGDGLAGFFYRDDGYKVWDALHMYVGGVLRELYGINNEAMLRDATLAAFFKECSDKDKARFPGFPAAPTDIAQVQRVLTTIIWTASCQHAALNNAQETNYQFVPNKPASLWRGMFGVDGTEEVNAQYIATRPDIAITDVLQALPQAPGVMFQTLMSYLLTLPSEKTLLDLINLHPIGTKMDGPLRDLHFRLSEIDKDIKHRNWLLRSEGKMDYPFLEPGRIPASVEI